MSPRGWPARVAVLGGGTMGTGLARLLALAGLPCTVADTTRERAEDSVARAIGVAEAHERDGLIAPGAAAAVRAGVTAADHVEAAAHGADLVLEAVAEDPAVKDSVLHRVEAVVAPDAVIATNTSAIPIRRLAAPLSAPARFLGVHWFNPPQWVPCVEVIPAPRTDERVVERMVDLLVYLKKRPVVVGDGAGFVANRIQFAMFREAAAVVEDGVATPEQVDEVVRASFGFRLPFFGPFTIADMAGLDVYAGAYAALRADLGERFAAPPSLERQLEQDRPGVKAGAGYREYGPDDAERLEARRDRAYLELARLLDGLS